MNKDSIAKKDTLLKKLGAAGISAVFAVTLCLPTGLACAGEGNADESIITKVVYDEDYDGMMVYFDDILIDEAKSIIVDRLGWKIDKESSVYEYDWGKENASGVVRRSLIANYPTNEDGTNYAACRDLALATDHIIDVELYAHMRDGNWRTPQRLSHKQAIGTMDSIVTRGWSDCSCDSVVVVSQDAATDGMVATGLAGLLDCPVITTEGNNLSLQTEAQINRLEAANVYLVGGTSVLSNSIESAIASLPYVENVERVWGYSAADTSVAVFDKGVDLGGWGNTAIVAMSGDFRDAMSVSPYAYAKHAPILLSDEDGLSDAAASAASNFASVIIAGGPRAVPEVVDDCLSDASAMRVYGQTAYDTSRAFIDWCVEQGMSLNYAGIATGENHMDAVAGAALCGKYNAPLLLVSDSSASEAIEYFGEHANEFKNGFVFGGASVISESAYNELINMVGGVKNL